jgi:hypothetical protein
VICFCFVVYSIVFDILVYIFGWIDTNIVACCLFGVCADVAPRGREGDMVQAPVPPEQDRPARGARRPRDAAAGAAGPERPAQRRRWDDPGAGPSHAPSAVAGVDEDIVRRFETVLRDVPERLWIQIQDEDVLEQCVGFPPPWREGDMVQAPVPGPCPPLAHEVLHLHKHQTNNKQ